jgi:hypothetical protein
MITLKEIQALPKGTQLKVQVTQIFEPSEITQAIYNYWVTNNAIIVDDRELNNTEKTVDNGKA